MDILQGFTMGLAYLAPIGLQNLFVINTALTQKRRRVYSTALIVIFFDVALAFTCFYGVGAIMAASPVLERVILLVGSLIVMYMGAALLRSKAAESAQPDMNIGLGKVISMAFAVTWLNPQAVIDGSMMLGAFKAALAPHQASQFILGVSLASCTWFLFLSTAVSLFGSRLTPKILRGINVICGVVILAYGARLGYSFVRLMWG